jgi:hypothetical protein
MTNIYDPPPTAELPLSLGRDVILTFRNKVPGSDPAAYVDYPDGVSVTLEIGKGPSKISSGAATISGSNATCRIESELTDGVREGALWRVVVSKDNGSLVDDEVPLNGKVVRSDGA